MYVYMAMDTVRQLEPHVGGCAPAAGDRVMMSVSSVTPRVTTRITIRYLRVGVSNKGGGRLQNT